MSKVDVIIPTYKPGEELFVLLRELQSQSRRPDHIIIMNTEKKYLDGIMQSHNIEQEFPELIIHNIKKSEFDHGATRDKGMQLSDADFVLLMTQDAMPRDNKLISSLLKVFDDEQVAAAYGRQYPKSDCNLAERFSRKFNYPDKPMRKTESDVNKLGIKTYFCSNVCAMYRHETYNKLGGFIKNAIFNEDMIYAGTAAKAGYAICYVPQAGVIHSHNYTFMQQFHRNFDLGVSQAQHPEIFGNIKSEDEGIKMVKKTIAHFISLGKIYLVPHYIIMSGFKFIGYRLGKSYKKLPKSVILFCTMNRSYWDNNY